MSMKHQLIAGLVLLGVFGSGVLFGGFGTMVVLKHMMPKAPIHREMVKMRQDPMLQRVFQKISNELALDEAQKKLVHAELSKMSEEFSVLHQSTAKKLGTIVDRGNANISKHLNDEQKKLFGEFVARRKFMIRKHMQGRGEGPRYGHDRRHEHDERGFGD